MAESAARLVDEVLPPVPIRQWVLSFPYQLRLLLAQQPEMMRKVLEIVYRTLATRLIRKAGFNKHSAQTGAVTLIQRFGSALYLNSNAARYIFTCCFSTAFTPRINTAPYAFTASRPRAGKAWCLGA